MNAASSHRNALLSVGHARRVVVIVSTSAVDGRLVLTPCYDTLIRQKLRELVGIATIETP